MTHPVSAPRAGSAIVTGASSGIGKVSAERLAARGHDLILVARREDRLRWLAADLEARFGIRAEVLVADLGQPAGDSALTGRLTSDAAVSLLVNNAGVSAMQPLTETPDDVVAGIIALNVIALTALSKAALAAFRAKGGGTIINVGSGAGFASYPGIAVYGATKAYVYLFTQALQLEAEGTGVRVQLVLPGAVTTEAWEAPGNSARNALPPTVVMTVEHCVDAAFSGLDLRERVTAPSLHDAAVLQTYETAAGGLLQAMFDGQPAARYGLGGARDDRHALNDG